MNLKNIVNEIKNLTGNEVKFIYYPKPKNIDLFPTTVQLKTTYNNKIIQSWGSDFDSNIALKKSIFELYERILFYSCRHLSYKKNCFFQRKKYFINEIYNNTAFSKKVNSTTSGTAVHVNQKKSIKNSINEYIERHVVIKASAQKIKPKKITISHIFNNKKLLNNYQIMVEAFCWKGPLQKYITLIKIKPQYLPGSLYSFGCDNTIDLSLKKSFLEGSGMISFLINNKKIVVKDAISKIQNHHLNSHSPYYENLFSNCMDLSIPKIDTDISKKNLFTSTISFNVSNNILYYTRSVSPKLQHLIVEKPRVQHLNLSSINNPSTGFFNDFSIIC